MWYSQQITLGITDSSALALNMAFYSVIDRIRARWLKNPSGAANCSANSANVQSWRIKTKTASTLKAGE
jgi:hypothetical protein